MNDGLKQRIVGALVLLALGMIFVPVIFDRERIVPVDRETQIPPQPERDILALPAPPVPPRPRAPAIAQPIDGQFDIEEADEPSTANTPKEAAGEAVEQKESKTGLDPAWVLQVASFESHERALEVLKELESMNYRGFIRDVETKQGSRTRVFVGPNVDKATLEKAKLKVDQHFKVDAFMLRFRP